MDYFQNRPPMGDIPIRASICRPSLDILVRLVGNPFAMSSGSASIIVLASVIAMSGNRGGPPVRSVLERAEKYILCLVDVPCWFWMGDLDDHGYGRLYAGRRNGRPFIGKAHRVLYEECVGPISDGLEPDHLCRNPQCVNHDHLEPVTHKENTLRALRETHCVNGHELSGSNLVTLHRTLKSGPTEYRRCRQCNRDAKLREYWRDPEKFRARKRQA